MSTPEPITQTLKISEVKASFSRLVNAVYRGGTRVILEKSGIPVAALISVADLERLERYDEEWNQAFAVIDRMREAFKDIPPEQIERDVAAIVRQIREEDDAAFQAETDALKSISAAFADVPIPELERRVDQIIAEGRASDAAERERQPDRGNCPGSHEGIQDRNESMARATML